MSVAAERFIEDPPAVSRFSCISRVRCSPADAGQGNSGREVSTKNGGAEFPNPVYAAMLESVDQGIGRLRAKLKQSGIERDTIIIVTSDNGGVVHPRITDNSPLHAGKGISMKAEFASR